MTAVDVEFPEGVFTVTCLGWTGPDPALLEVLADVCPPTVRPGVRDYAVAAARRAVKALGGTEVGRRDVPDPYEEIAADPDGVPPTSAGSDTPES
jgi:hypothetical protein